MPNRRRTAVNTAAVHVITRCPLCTWPSSVRCARDPPVSAVYVILLSVTRVRWHHSEVRMGAMASQITSLTIVYSTVYSGLDQRKHQSSASPVFVRGIHRWPHKWPGTRKMLPFDDVIMKKEWEWPLRINSDHNQYTCTKRHENAPILLCYKIIISP